MKNMKKKKKKPINQTPKSKKRFFLIDIENVGKSFLDGIEDLTENDTLIICNNTMVYSEFSPAILEGLQKTKATVQKFYINNVSKNAMDFELSVEIGFLIAKYGDKAQYFVVSKDRAFDIVNDYIKNKGLSTVVKRIPSLRDFETEEKRIQDMEENIRELLPQYPQRIISTVQIGIDQTTTQQEFFSFLKKHLKYDVDVVYPIVKCLCVNG